MAEVQPAIDLFIRSLLLMIIMLSSLFQVPFPECAVGNFGCLAVPLLQAPPFLQLPSWEMEVGLAVPLQQARLATFLQPPGWGNVGRRRE